MPGAASVTLNGQGGQVHRGLEPDNTTTVPAATTAEKVKVVTPNATFWRTVSFLLS
jgi:hypothetical protein